MNGLAFLLLRSAKNRLLELRRKPAKLVLYIIVVLFIVGMIVLFALLPSDNDGGADIVYLKGIIFAFFLLFFYTAIKSGLSQGSTLFGMEDVNLLFVSPVNPRSILIYGVFRVVKTMALTSIFILFQGGTLKSFGVGVGGLAVLYAGYFLTAVVTQILGMFIYSMTNGRKKRQRIVIILSVAVFVPMLVTAALHVRTAGGDYLGVLRSTVESPATSYVPIVGWASEGIVAFLTGEAAAGALFFGLLVLLGAALVAVIYVGKPDYYEDVLVASETAFEQKRNLAEGNINALGQNSKKPVRVKGTGIGGWGASAFFFKHLRESFRTNRFGLWGISTIALTVGSFALAYIMKTAMGDDAAENHVDVVLFTLLGTLMWLQMFLVSMGRGLKETYGHYIYMAPVSPFLKMVWSNLEIMIKATVEGVLIFASAGVIIGADAGAIALSVMAYALFIFMLIAINYLSMRFTGTDISAGLLITLYMFAVLIIILPGIVLAIVAGIFGGLHLALAALAAWELAVALFFFWASRGILHNCDIQTLRQIGNG